MQATFGKHGAAGWSLCVFTSEREAGEARVHTAVILICANVCICLHLQRLQAAENGRTKSQKHTGGWCKRGERRHRFVSLQSVFIRRSRWRARQFS